MPWCVVLAGRPKGGRREDKRGVGCVQLWSLGHLSDPPKHHLTFITVKICTCTRVLLLIFVKNCCFVEIIGHLAAMPPSGYSRQRTHTHERTHTCIWHTHQRKKTLSNFMNTRFKKQCWLCEITFKLKHSDIWKIVAGLSRIHLDKLTFRSIQH